MIVFHFFQAKYVKTPKNTTLLVVCPLGKEYPVSAKIMFNGLGEAINVLNTDTKIASPPIANSRIKPNLLWRVAIRTKEIATDVAAIAVVSKITEIVFATDVNEPELIMAAHELTFKLTDKKLPLK